jgi:hypothetical protein
LDENRDEVISSLELAQSYAKTRQVPLGYNSGDLTYVQLSVVGAYLVAGVNGVGTTYFAQAIDPNLPVKMDNDSLYFWGGNGFLSHDKLGTMYETDETANIYIQSQNDVIGYDQVVVNALGQVSLGGYNDGVASIFTVTPTSAPTPTSAVPTSLPTSLPTPTVAACLLGGTACSVHGDCCSYYCDSGFCLAPSPTPIPCLLGGTACSVHGQCCSAYCSVGFCQ